MEPFMSPLYRNIILGIIFACVLIQLLPKSDPRAEVLRDPFLIGHSLDPTYGPDSSYRSWSISQWRDWIDQREPMHRAAAQTIKWWRKHKLNEKPINTVIIATPSEIAQAFYGPLSMLRNEYAWSNRMFETYVIEIKKDGRYIIFRCPPTYIAVTLKDGKPVHIEGQSDIKIATGQTNYPRRTQCVKLS